MTFIKNIMAEVNLSYISMPNISATTIIDILIVACIIYNVLLWIKETRAWSLLKGIIIILILSALSFIFNLYTLSWIINKTSNVGVIALIILFTPEIRKALEQIGSNGNIRFLFSTNIEDRQISSKALDGVIRACTDMGKVRTGAIIVIENNVAIGDLAKTGIPIDAEITRQLLVNIFEHNTPLHDGAVVIRENRISAACCILPLTEKEIGKELGTRHRAAVGVSEIADAFVLVVSEETGHISLAHSGKLMKNINIDEIKNTIKFSSDTDKKRKSQLKGRGKNE